MAYTAYPRSAPNTAPTIHLDFIRTSASEGKTPQRATQQAVLSLHPCVKKLIKFLCVRECLIEWGVGSNNVCANSMVTSCHCSNHSVHAGRSDGGPCRCISTLHLWSSRLQQMKLVLQPSQTFDWTVLCVFR